jgi:hypothetical protein
LRNWHNRKRQTVCYLEGCEVKDLEITEKDTVSDAPEVKQTLRERLRAPLPAGAIKPHPTKSWMSSINGAFIVERLNDCFGEDGWLATYTVIEGTPEQKMVVVRCDFVARHQDMKEIARSCFGGNDNPDRGDAYKGACTDALGKVASQLGIAGEVYKGMLDEVQAPAQKQKVDKRKYEGIHGTVTELRNISPSQVYFQVNNNGMWIRTMQVVDADKLRNSLGCKVEVTAFWDKGKAKKNEAATDVLTITAVHGVFEAVPKTAYVRKAEDENQEDEHLSPDMAEVFGKKGKS